MKRLFEMVYSSFIFMSQNIFLNARIDKDEKFLRGNFPQLNVAYFCTFLENIKKIAIDMLIHCQAILKNVISIGFCFQQVLSPSQFLYLHGIEL